MISSRLLCCPWEVVGGARVTIPPAGVSPTVGSCDNTAGWGPGKIIRGIASGEIRPEAMFWTPNWSIDGEESDTTFAAPGFTIGTGRWTVICSGCGTIAWLPFTLELGYFCERSEIECRWSGWLSELDGGSWFRFWRRRLLFLRIPKTMRVPAMRIRANPPMTPPTIAPTGVFLLEDEVLMGAPVKSACPCCWIVWAWDTSKIASFQVRAGSQGWRTILKRKADKWSDTRTVSTRPVWDGGLAW